MAELKVWHLVSIEAVLVVLLVFFYLSSLSPGKSTLKDRVSPFDRIKEEQIHVLDDRVIVELRNAERAKIADTNSMDPVIDKDSSVLQIVPKSPEDIHVGDIISYSPSYNKDLIIIHRVIEIGTDEKGYYYKAKGDNSPWADPGKIRFEDISRILVGVLY
ncbi:hypothetical protein D6745_01980 [Candidatus Woesearchaeota archaeon]|nr:MAG: hypothetical protein D6745_01980 [Candidatus Woesearchaeota archaeon]